MGAAAEGRARPFYLLGWAGSKALDRVLAPVGCGCELAWRAVTDSDHEARAVWAEDAPKAQRRWRCPAAGYTPPADRSELDAECRAVLDEADRLAKGRDCGATCPLAASRYPVRADGTSVAEAVIAARAWREHGELRARVGWPSLALCEAIDEVDRGHADRMDAERKEAERKRERGDGAPTDE